MINNEEREYSMYLKKIQPDDIIIAYGIQTFTVLNNVNDEFYVESYEHDIIQYDDIDEIQREYKKTGEYRTVWQSINSVRHRREAEKRMNGEK